MIITSFLPCSTSTPHITTRSSAGAVNKLPSQKYFKLHWLYYHRNVTFKSSIPRKLAVEFTFPVSLVNSVVTSSWRPICDHNVHSSNQFCSPISLPNSSVVAIQLQRPRCKSQLLVAATIILNDVNTWMATIVNLSHVIFSHITIMMVITILYETKQARKTCWSPQSPSWYHQCHPLLSPLSSSQ